MLNNYDGFTNNLVRYLETPVVEVKVIRNAASSAQVACAPANLISPARSIQTLRHIGTDDPEGRSAHGPEITGAVRWRVD